MRLIHNNTVSDPHINLASEEFCLRNPDMTEDYEDKYESWDWTFVRSPDFVVRQFMQYEDDQAECFILVRRGVINEISICDNSRKSVTSEKLESKFIGRHYNEVQFQT